jgi:probable HAF family extracellular repeat protein
VWKYLGAICAICFAFPAYAQNRYQITRIPTAQGVNSAALGLNNKGQIVGYSFQGEDYQAFLFSAGDQSVTDLGSLGGKINAACAVNDAGQVTGYSQDGNGNILAFLYSPNQPITSLGTLDGASTSEAFGINRNGTAVGDSQSGGQNHRPVLFSKNSVQDLGLGGSNEPDAMETAYAINDAGQIVGRHSAANNAFHAFSFLNGTTTDFSTLGGANGEALGINKNGLVVGDSETASGSTHATVFDHSQLKDLGTLPGFETASYARGINSSGDIVGESDSGDQKRAFLYTKGHLIELDKLAEKLSEAGFSSLDVAYGINDHGWIAGYGTTSDNLTAAFIAVPEDRADQGQAGGAPQTQGPPPVGPAQPQPQGPGQAQPVTESDQDDYDVFYSGLSSDEGNWVEAGNYGYCFRPRVSADWRPYQDGHWVWTDRGWYWSSNERFGWATYHYGRWANIDGNGWCWVPGNQWAPAWVSWRESNEHVGWAPLPPEADISVNRSISSWSDSYYGIGPAAYAFINFSHWREPSYARFIERPERNVQIIRETRNVTNIVTNNNVINNFGPQAQMVARRTNHNIPQVKLAFNRAADPRAHYGQTRQGNQLNVIAPPANLNPQARQAPSVQNRIENPQVERGWRGVKTQDAENLKKTIADQNPTPNNLPKPAPLVRPRIGGERQGAATPGAAAAPVLPGSPAPVVGQKPPANLLKPGARPPNANVAPGATPNPQAPGRKPIPPNLLGAKPFATPGRSPVGPGGKPTVPASPGPNQSPNGNVPGATPGAPKGAPPNLNAPRPSPAVVPPKAPGNPPGNSTPKPTVNPPPGQNIPRAPATPRAPQEAPPNLNTPRPSPAAVPPKAPGNPPAGNPTPAPTVNPPPRQNIPRAPATPQGAAAPAQEKKPEPAPTQAPVSPVNPVIPNPRPAPQQPTKQEAPKSTPVPAPEIKATPREIPGPKATPVPAPQGAPATAPKPVPAVKAAPPAEVRQTPAPRPQVSHTPAAKPPPQKAPAPKPQIKTPAPPVQHTPAPQARTSHAPAAKPVAQKPPAPKPQIKTPAPQVEHPSAPRPQAAHAPAQKPPPPKQPQGGQKHPPAKPKPTPS